MLLGCIATDAPVSPAALQSTLDYAVLLSFKAISVDGDMSTNDMVVLFANGAGSTGIGTEGGEGSCNSKSKVSMREVDEARDPGAFLCVCAGLMDFMQELVQLVMRDGEGGLLPSWGTQPPSKNCSSCQRAIHWHVQEEGILVLVHSGRHG